MKTLLDLREMAEQLAKTSREMGFSVHEAYYKRAIEQIDAELEGPVSEKMNLEVR